MEPRSPRPSTGTPNRRRFGRATVPAAAIAATGVVLAGTGAGIASAAEEGDTHTVASGETLIGIAEQEGVDVDALASANGIAPSSWVYVGQELTIPSASGEVSVAGTDGGAIERPDTVEVVDGDSAVGIADRFGVSVDALLAENSLGWTSIIYPGQQLRIPDAGTQAEPVLLTTSELNDPMTENAELIIAIGRERGVSDHGIVTALVAAMAESGIRNLDHGDRDSVGIFQQRPSTGWGTSDEIQDRRRSISAFYGGDGDPNDGRTVGLLDIDGWEGMSAGDAAQAVQKSAFPAAYGRWETSARQWLADLG